METTLAITPCDMGEVLPLLAALTRPKTDTSAGLASVGDLCAGQAFKVQANGHTVAAYTAEIQHMERGACVLVTSLAGNLPGTDLALTIDRAVTEQARQVGAKQVAMLTKRRGLIRKLAAHGWTVAAIKMVKKI